MSVSCRYSDYLEYYIQVGVAGNRVVGVNFLESPEGKENESKILDDIFSYLNGEDIDLSKHEIAITVGGKKRKALEKTRRIPKGSTITYDELADSIGGEKNEVKKAIDSNPVPILLPSHRVVEENQLGGFSGPVEVKKLLLELEGSI